MRVGATVVRASRVAWLALCVVVLAWPLVMSEDVPTHLRHHWYAVQVMWMYVLAFPVGLLYYIALAIALRTLELVTGVVVGNGPAVVVCLHWLPVVVLGYWQWFVWLPKRVDAWRKGA